MQDGSRVSEMVKPGFFGPVMLDTIQMFFPVVHVVLEGPVTVIAEVPPPHDPDVCSDQQDFNFTTSEMKL